MKQLILLLATLALVLAMHPAHAAARAGFDTPLTAQVFTAALTFATPRTLDPVTPADLTLWGLHGITALDPSLAAGIHHPLQPNPTVQDAALHSPPLHDPLQHDPLQHDPPPQSMLQLTAGERVLLTKPLPAPDDATAWGQAAADIAAAAYANSAILRRAGAPALMQSFFDEMFSHLDPYSRYVPPDPAEQERDRLSIDASAGLSLIRHAGSVQISDIVPGGPAAAAGLRVGDSLLSIDDHPVARRRLSQIVTMLTGDDGTETMLRVRRLDGTTRDVPVTLAFVPPETVFAERRDDLLILRITSFTSNTAQRLSQAIEAGLLAHTPPAAIIIDLRGNRGGLLRQAVTTVALFAEQGVIASTAGRDPEATHDWRIDGGGDLTHGAKLIILVDGRTASAAEIMAAALADLGRAVVVGSATLGKGMVQTPTRLPDGGELFVTWSRVIAPRGWPIQSIGILPQLCTSQGEDQTHQQFADLAAGRQDMAEALARTRTARAPLPVADALELREACPAAEGGDIDLVAAHFLAAHSRAYQTALLQ